MPDIVGPDAGLDRIAALADTFLTVDRARFELAYQFSALPIILTARKLVVTIAWPCRRNYTDSFACISN